MIDIFIMNYIDLIQDLQDQRIDAQINIRHHQNLILGLSLYFEHFLYLSASILFWFFPSKLNSEQKKIISN